MNSKLRRFINSVDEFVVTSKYNDGILILNEGDVYTKQYTNDKPYFILSKNKNTNKQPFTTTAMPLYTFRTRYRYIKDSIIVTRLEEKFYNTPVNIGELESFEVTKNIEGLAKGLKFSRNEKKDLFVNETLTCLPDELIHYSYALHEDVVSNLFVKDPTSIKPISFFDEKKEEFLKTFHTDVNKNNSTKCQAFENYMLSLLDKYEKEFNAIKESLESDLEFDKFEQLVVLENLSTLLKHLIQKYN